MNSEDQQQANVVKLKRRSEAEQESYWAGFKAGLASALHGVQSALDRFELTRQLEQQKQQPRDN